MLSYQHGYHAGNRADIHKHGLLAWLLQRLTQKNKPACYIDVYAGRGFYDLEGSFARKTGEASDGITQLKNVTWPASLQCWKQLIDADNPADRWRYYGGSPHIASRLLRDTDTLIFCELHDNEFSRLNSLFNRDSRCNLHHRDAHEALNALLPPMPRRGLALIDPPYEVKKEYDQMVTDIKLAADKWPVGSIMLWYPILEAGRHTHMLRQLKQLKLPLLIGEWQWRQAWHEDTRGMLGSGVVVCHPPWQADVFLKQWQQQLIDWFPDSEAVCEVVNAS